MRCARKARAEKENHSRRTKALQNNLLPASCCLAAEKVVEII